MTYRCFQDARSFVHTVELNTVKEFRDWTNSSQRPDDIPKYPNKTYAENWVGWADWLGKAPRSFEQAREFARHLGLRTREEWVAFSGDGKLPRDIPLWPQNIYKNQGWDSWADWLGRTENSRFRPFHEAREFARSLKLTGRREWSEFSQSGARPADVPSSPGDTYCDQGWAGFDDWLGTQRRWNRNAILAFLNSMRPIIQDLEPAELFAILLRNGLIGKKFPTNTNASIIKSLEHLCRAANPTSLIDNLAIQLDKLKVDVDSDSDATHSSSTSDELDEATLSDLSEAAEVPELASVESLTVVDRLVESSLVSDGGVLDFLVTNRVAALWQKVLDGDERFSPENLDSLEGGVYLKMIRDRFKAQYQGAASLPIPDGYSFKKNGVLQNPNLMQRLAAYRLQSERFLGNWSGVGAGKTLAAILASRVIDARFTVIVAVNATVERWGEEIQRTFPDARVVVKSSDIMNVSDAPTYLVLNFESFQQKWSEQFISDVVENHRVDFIVLDEVQSVRQRMPSHESRRRKLVHSLITQASKKNADLRVLGMSATPVINNLFEGRTMLELISQEDHSDLKVRPTVINAVRMHQQLMLCGIRYRPRYKLSLQTKMCEIDGRDMHDQLVAIPPRNVLRWEQAMLTAKLPQIESFIRPGVLIYTQFVSGMVEPLVDLVSRCGLRAGIFTGEEKGGLEEFLSRDVDVLIGSSPIGTGVDGLQTVCDRLIFACLPWTGAEYEQIVGRLHRQGSEFAGVEVIIPQVVLQNGGSEWSWDKRRWDRIQWKRTLADAAIDGVIPEGQLPSKEDMQSQSQAALQNWIAEYAGASRDSSTQVL